MKIIGLCKTFSGHEFIQAALEATYDFVDKFVFVNSDCNWLGEPGENKVRIKIEEWQKEKDTKNKIQHINGSYTNQVEQYSVGYNFIKENYDSDWIYLFDSDEILDVANIERAKVILENEIYSNAIFCQMHTYVKSPFYRVTPPETCKPCIFLRPVFLNFPEVRCGTAKPQHYAEDLFFHHFTYVRENEEDVFEKIRTSLKGDILDNKSCQVVDLNVWKEYKWKQLPQATNFHATKYFEDSWQKIKVVGTNDLPEAVRNLDIVKEGEQK